MLLSTGLGQCYGWRDILLDLILQGGGKGLEYLKKLQRGSGHLDEFLRYGGGGGRHFLGDLGGKIGGGLDDVGSGFGRSGRNGFHGGGGGRGGDKDSTVVVVAVDRAAAVAEVVGAAQIL
jgi:hypothetical protein